jgi:hypothetical protein
MNSSKILFVLLGIIFLSCNKSDQNSEVNDLKKRDYLKNGTANKNLNSGSIMRTTNSIVNQLLEDSNFIRMYKIDQNIFGFRTDTTSESEIIQITDAMIDQSKNLNSKKEAIDFFESSGFDNASSLVNLFIEKENSIIGLVNNLPDLGSLNQQELKAIIIQAYLELDKIESFRQPGCRNPCCYAYVDAVTDCDDDFAIATAGAVLAATVATVTGTPVAGGFALWSVMTPAYLQHTRCTSSAARSYKRCMGYIQ